MATADEQLIEIRAAQKALGYIQAGESFSAQASVEGMRADAAWVSGLGTAAASAIDIYAMGYGRFWAKPETATSGVPVTTTFPNTTQPN
jgi:hypothetical protein